MIGRKAEAVLNRAVRYAVENEHEYFTLEHVLWALLSEIQIIETIRACSGDPADLRLQLEEHIGREIPRAPRSNDPATLSKSEKSGEEPPLEHPVATLSIQRLIQRALP